MNLPREIDTSAAEAYETYLVPGMMAPWAELVVSDARVGEGMQVLDVACGTGVAARQAARCVGSSGKAFGIDIDHGMLTVARVVSLREQLSIKYENASACGLPFESESFDAAFCLQGLQYFSDPLKTLSELRRVLRANAVLASASWSEIDNCKGHWAIVSALERRDIDAAAVRKPFAAAVATDLHSLALEAGFRDVSIRTEMREGKFRSAAAFVEAMLQGSTSSRYALEKVPSDDWSDFLSEVEDALAPWSSATGIAFPMESNVIVAYR
jgi:SAM-dependent methyltransferase